MPLHHQAEAVDVQAVQILRDFQGAFDIAMDVETEKADRGPPIAHHDGGPREKLGKTIDRHGFDVGFLHGREQGNQFLMAEFLRRLAANKVANEGCDPKGEGAESWKKTLSYP